MVEKISGIGRQQFQPTGVSNKPQKVEQAAQNLAQVAGSPEGAIKALNKVVQQQAPGIGEKLNCCA